MKHTLECIGVEKRHFCPIIFSIDAAYDASLSFFYFIFFSNYLPMYPLYHWYCRTSQNAHTLPNLSNQPTVIGNSVPI